ncbi:MAG: hypothetical protein V1743_08285 [Nanoarchaeota archaeon]
MNEKLPYEKSCELADLLRSGSLDQQMTSQTEKELESLLRTGDDWNHRHAEVFPALQEKNYALAATILENMRAYEGTFSGTYYDSALLFAQGGHLACRDPVGFCYAQLGEHEKARESHLIAAQIYASQRGSQVYMAAGGLYEAAGEPVKALEMYQAWLAEHPPGHNGYSYGMADLAKSKVTELKKKLNQT